MAYLDATGLARVWDKVKSLVSAHTANVTQTLTTGTEIGTVDGVSLYAPSGGGGSQTTWYGTCSTSASGVNKAVTCEGFSLNAGAIIGILFTTANSAATPKLNVNSTGNKTIYIGSDTVNSTTNTLKWSPNTMLFFMYDGTYFRYISAQAGAAVQHPDGAGSWYGLGSVAAGTAAKTTAIDNFRLTKGAIVVINHTTSNTAAAPTLNVNSTGAKAIYYRGSAASSSNPVYWPTNSILTFLYSGSYWYLVSMQVDTGWVAAISDSTSVNYRLKDGWCTIIADGTYTTSTSSGWQTVFTLPQEARPSTSPSALRFVWYDHARSEWRRGQITVGGNVQLNQSGTADGAEFTVTFPVL